MRHSLSWRRRCPRRKLAPASRRTSVNRPAFHVVTLAERCSLMSQRYMSLLGSCICQQHTSRERTRCIAAEITSDLCGQRSGIQLQVLSRHAADVRARHRRAGGADRGRRRRVPVTCTCRRSDRKRRAYLFCFTASGGNRLRQGLYARGFDLARW